MKADTLNGISSTIENAISSTGLVVYHCANLEELWELGVEPGGDQPSASESPFPVLEWDHVHGGYERFIHTAKLLGVAVVYVKAKRFSWREDLYGAIESARLPPDKKDSLCQEAQRYAGYDGFVEYILLAFKTGGVWHAYQETSEWYQSYCGLLGDCCETQ